MSLAELPANTGPYGLDKAEKAAYYRAALSELTEYHRARCTPYRRLLDAMGWPKEYHAVEEVPFLPVSLFKDMELKSVPEDAVYRTLTSSGTSGQRPSKIFLDEETSRSQQRALARIVTDFIGPRRLPMLVLDSRAVLRDRKRFSARGAGILGFSLFATGMTYAFSGDMEPDLRIAADFARQYSGEPVLLFGFTYLVWRFLQALKATGTRLDLAEGILIHGGGWKKLRDQAVSPDRFKAEIQEWTGIARVHDYYGMAEQTGSVFLECECGHLHASVWSEVLVRRPEDFGLCAAGEEGVIQVLSPLPRSYPGHSLLTEDMGILLGEDDCPCGRKGKYFSVSGRIPRAEVRGCSDTYEK